MLENPSTNLLSHHEHQPKRRFQDSERGKNKGYTGEEDNPVHESTWVQSRGRERGQGGGEAYTEPELLCPQRFVRRNKSGMANHFYTVHLLRNGFTQLTKYSGPRHAWKIKCPPVLFPLTRKISLTFAALRNVPIQVLRGCSDE